MKLNIKPKAKATLLLSVALMGSANAAMADLGERFTAFGTFGANAASAVTIILWLSAVVLLLLAGWMWYGALKNPNDPSKTPGKAITLIAIACLLAAGPGLLGFGVESILGDGITTNTSAGFSSLS